MSHPLKGYDILNGSTDFLGGGTFGQVWRGRSQFSSEEVAVKVAPRRPFGPVDDEEEARTFEQKYIIGEIQKLISVRHKNIVEVLDSHLTTDVLYIVMELCEEGSLNAFILKQRKLPQTIRTSFVKQMTSGIQCLHDNNIIHRDIKPDNLLVKKEHGGYVIKVTDLGLAKRVPDVSALASASGVGTPDWMAPDIFPNLEDRVKYGKAADVFSLGLVFLAMVNHVPGKKLMPIKGNLTIFNQIYKHM